MSNRSPAGARSKAAIRWTIRDRATGQSITIAGPLAGKAGASQRDDLLTVIKNCSNVGVVRGGR